MLRTKGLGRLAHAKKQNASETLALRRERAIVSIDYYMLGVTVCQQKNATRNSKAVGHAILTVVAVNFKPVRSRPALHPLPHGAGTCSRLPNIL